MAGSLFATSTLGEWQCTPDVFPSFLYARKAYCFLLCFLPTVNALAWTACFRIDVAIEGAGVPYPPICCCLTHLPNIHSAGQHGIPDKTQK